MAAETLGSPRRITCPSSPSRSPRRVPTLGEPVAFEEPAGEAGEAREAREAREAMAVGVVETVETVTAVKAVKAV